MDKRFTWGKDGYRNPALFLLGLYVGCVMPCNAKQDEWRTWLMTDDEGDRIGNDKFPTSDAAQAALYDAALARVTETEKA